MQHFAKQFFTCKVKQIVIIKKPVNGSYFINYVKRARVINAGKSIVSCIKIKLPLNCIVNKWAGFHTEILLDMNGFNIKIFK